MGKQTFEVKRYHYEKSQPKPGTCGACSKFSVWGRKRIDGYCMKFRRSARADEECASSDNALISED